MNRNTQILFALALLGVGAYVFMRRARASTSQLITYGGEAIPTIDPNSFLPDWSQFNFNAQASDPLMPSAQYPQSAQYPVSNYSPSGVDFDTLHASNDPGIFSTIGQAIQPQTYMNPIDDPNVRAFLDMIGYSEGADYNTLFGGGTFDSFYDHPRQVISKSGYKSSAAGKYQIIQKTWDDVAPKIGAQDFLPATQDAAAIYLIKRRGALNDVIAGNFTAAVQKVRKEWASLPGAGYGQPERSLAQLQTVYQQAGGTVTGYV